MRYPGVQHAPTQMCVDTDARSDTMNMQARVSIFPRTLVSAPMAKELKKIIMEGVMHPRLN